MTVIKRTGLRFEGQFVQVPNSWARDGRLSRKARGILIEILSHSRGWVVTEARLIEAGQEGRDAIRSGLTELVQLGYLERAQSRDHNGTFAESTLELADPWTEKPSTDNPQAGVGLPVDGSPVDGKPAPIRTPFLKNTITQEHQEKNLSSSSEEDALSTLKELLSENWRPTQKHIDLAASYGANISREVDRFRDHAHRTQRRAKNWNTAFTNWLRKGAEMSQQRAVAGGTARSTAGTAVERMAERLRAANSEGVRRELGA